MRSLNDILVAPMVTEKASNAKAQMKYVFEVSMDTNKVEIKKAIEKLYGVSVDKVNVAIIKPRKKRVRTKQGFTSWRKKAVVTLKDGEIDIYK